MEKCIEQYIKQLEELANEVCDYKWGREFDRITVCLQNAIETRYMKLPLDKHGKPIRPYVDLYRNGEHIPADYVDAVNETHIFYYDSGIGGTVRCLADTCTIDKPREISDAINDFEKVINHDAMSRESMLEYAKIFVDDVLKILENADD